jgi:hypothetical protein
MFRLDARDYRSVPRRKHIEPSLRGNIGPAEHWSRHIGKPAVGVDLLHSSGEGYGRA